MTRLTASSARHRFMLVVAAVVVGVPLINAVLGGLPFGFVFVAVFVAAFLVNQWATGVWKTRSGVLYLCEGLNWRRVGRPQPDSFRVEPYTDWTTALYKGLPSAKTPDDVQAFITDEQGRDVVLMRNRVYRNGIHAKGRWNADVKTMRAYVNRTPDLNS